MSAKALYQISLKVFLKNAKGEVLILGVDDGGTYSGFFDLPGGRIHDDEFTLPLTQVLKREIEEETGIKDVELQPFPLALGRHRLPGKYEHADHDFQVLYVFFEGLVKSTQVKISHEHSSAQWVDLTKIDIEKYFISGIREGVEMYLARLKEKRIVDNRLKT